MSLLREVLSTLFLLGGAIFMLLAAIGVARMPDLFMRMQAATKASALGATLMFAATLVYFWDPPVTTRAVAAMVFIFLTLPIGAHLMSRSAYLVGTQIWQGTKRGLPDPYEEERVATQIEEVEEREAASGGFRK